MLLEAYERHLGQVRTLNSLNQINIAYGNTMTPQEVVELEAVLVAPGYAPPALREDRTFTDEELKAATTDWIEEALSLLRMIGKDDAEPFLRRDMRTSITLYTDGGPSADKTLIVAFPGANNRLMMPVAMLLQALAADRADIVLIRDPTHTAYFRGLEGLADSREAFLDSLPSLLNFAAYKRVSWFGVSAGGLPAILGALRHEAYAVLSCGPDSPLDPRLQAQGGAEALAILRSAVERGLRTRVTIGFGAQHADDRKAAEELGEILGVEPLAVNDPDRDVLHNILFPLARQNRLIPFLSESLGF